MLPTLKNWSALLIVTGAATYGFYALHLAAGLMLGPMIAAIVIAVSGRSVTIPPVFMPFCQSIIACMVAAGLTWPVLRGIALNVPVIGFSVLSVIVVSFGTGAVLAWLRIIPGTTALWGSSPGAASVMTLLAESFGADVRLVAFMLYFRVILVAITTSLVAHFVTRGSAAAVIPASHTGNLPLTLLLILVCAGLAATFGKKLRVPAAPMLLTLLIGCTITLSGTFQIVTPQWLRIPAYLILGWSVGVRFTGPVLRHALATLPATSFATVTLLAACGLLSIPVAHLAGVDPLTAYLATSPGGLDAIVIIAASVPVNLPFIVSLQTARMLIVMVLGPVIARPLGHWLEKRVRP